MMTRAADLAPPLPAPRRSGKGGDRTLFAPFTELLLARTLEPLGLVERDVPAWADGRRGMRKGEILTVRSRRWNGPRVRHMRLSHLHSATVFEAFNLLIVPSCESGAPIFGTEVLSFSGRPHLTVIDFQDLRKESPSWQRRWIDPLKTKASPLLSHATPRDEMPAWTAAFFSRLCFHLKPVGDRLPLCLEAFDAYLSHFVEALLGAPAVSADEVALMRRAHRRYHDDHLANEPAIRTLGSLFGEEWSARYAREFLFDGGSPADRPPVTHRGGTL